MRRAAFRAPVVLLAAWLGLACGGERPHPARPKPHPPAVAASSASATGVALGDKEGIAPETGTGFRKLDAVRARKHVVGAANPHASRAGLAMLRAGGSAVDAASAMALALTIVEPQSSGIGGGAFMLHYRAADRSLQAFDGRETAPKAATADMFLGPDGKPRSFYDAVVGGGSVGVPGELRMLALAHKQHGKLPWARLFEPAIALARDGFAISERLHALLKRDRFLRRGAAAAQHYYRSDGEPKAVGTVLKNPALEKVLREVASKGAVVFYQGWIARDIVAAVGGSDSNPGRLSAADMAGYRPVVRAPVCIDYRAYRPCGMPAPSSGGITTLQIFGLLERFDRSETANGSVTAQHRFAEASRLAYADRERYIGDPDFVSVPTSQLLADDYLARRSRLIADDKTLGRAPAGAVAVGGASGSAPDASLELPSTSHLVVADGEGNVVSMTASIENVFGSRVMVHGFLLNNELTDFSFVPEVDGRKVANRVQPGKRPRSSMAPLIVLQDGRPVLALGSPGGSRIINYVARTTLAILDGGLDPQAAIAQPNVVNRNGVTELEQVPGLEGWAAKTKGGLEALGHQVKLSELNSGLQAIVRHDDGWLGGADPRREGVILGD
jgi:gamma-glutamyltranspeptidase/glutathione hydrolase